MSMGYTDGPGYPEVKSLVSDLIRRVIAGGKHVGFVAGTANRPKPCSTAGLASCSIPPRGC
jgi:2-keto-3-deoxy-L-rhamnonate aldolase RhmA